MADYDQLLQPFEGSEFVNLKVKRPNGSVLLSESEPSPDSVKSQARRLVSLVRHMNLAVYSLEGEFEGQKLKIVVGDDGHTLPFIQDLAFPNGAKVAKIGKIGAFSGHRLAKSHADLVIVGANRLLRERYARHKFMLAPKWVRLFLPVKEEPFSRLYAYGRSTRKYFKWMIKKAQDTGYE